VIAASGDSGVGGVGTSPNCTRFIPTFPSSSPYVTVVGGTDFPHDDAPPDGTPSFTSYDEIGWTSSGGGFSDRYATPSWQADAVKKYIGKKGWLPPAELWNASGRGYPDVSAQARKYVVVANGFGISGISGTSAAAPVFAGLVSLLVSQRLRAGKPPLGFLNPLLYSHPEVFMDIEKGFNPGCGGLGFQATTGAVGWDPLTGLGTPNFQAMSKVVGQLP